VIKTGRTLRILTVPGLSGSGHLHWQTIWESKFGFSRIEQDNWDNPDYSQWEKSLLQNVISDPNKTEVVLVAHSLGCHLVVKSFPWIRDVVKGVLLVAPPDFNQGIIKQDLSSFFMTKHYELGCPGYLIYSENDPHASAAYSQKYGLELGLTCVSVGKHGHINSDSNLGEWGAGTIFLNEILKTVSRLQPVLS